MILMVYNFNKDEEINYNLYEVIFKSLDEFTRIGNFDRLFPREENLDKYSKFYDEPDVQNVFLW